MRHVRTHKQIARTRTNTRTKRVGEDVLVVGVVDDVNTRLHQLADHFDVRVVLLHPLREQ